MTLPPMPPPDPRSAERDALARVVEPAEWVWTDLIDLSDDLRRRGSDRRALAYATTDRILAAGFHRTGEVEQLIGRTLYEAFWKRQPGGLAVAWCDQASAIRNMWDAIAEDARAALSEPRP